MDTAPAVTTRSEKTASGTVLSTTTYFRKQFAEADLSEGCAQPSAEQIVRQVIVRRHDGNVDPTNAPPNLATSTSSRPDRTGIPDSKCNGGITKRPPPVRRPSGASSTSHGDPAGGGLPMTCGGRDTDGALAFSSDMPPGMLAREVTWYGVSPGPGNAGSCALAGSPPCAQTERSGFNRDAGEFQTETHSSNAGIRNQPGWISRTTTTNWTPNLTSWQLKLHSSRTTTDSGPCRACRRHDRIRLRRSDRLPEECEDPGNLGIDSTEHPLLDARSGCVREPVRGGRLALRNDPATAW